MAYSAYNIDHRTRIVARERDRRIVDSGERDRHTDRERERERDLQRVPYRR